MVCVSMEIYVLSNRRLASMEEWGDAIAKEGFPLTLSEGRPLEALSGHLPAMWKGKHAGFECDHSNIEELLEEYPTVDLRGQWTQALEFRWGANLTACLAGYVAAIAYASATQGVVFDPQEAVAKTPSEARETARKIEAELPIFEAGMRKVLAAFGNPKR
jgi:hypothetical protein